MSAAGHAEQQQQASFLHISDGEGELSCRLRWQTEASSVEREVRRHLRMQLADTPGFRPSSNVVPPALRNTARMIREKVLLERVHNDVIFHQKQINKRYLPIRAQEGDFTRNGGKFEIECEIELVPDVRLPYLEGCKLRFPAPAATDEDRGKALANFRERNSDWKNAERPAARGDRLIVQAETRPGSNIEPVELEINDSLSEEMAAKLIGLKVDDKFTFTRNSGDNVASPAMARVLNVQEKVVSEFDLSYVRRFMPEVASVAEFKEKFYKQFDIDLDKKVYQHSVKRSIHLLLSNTPDFPLPQRELEQVTKHLFKAMVDAGNIDPATVWGKSASEDNGSKTLDENTRRKISEHAAGRLRKRFVVEQFIIENSLEVSDSEVEQLVEMHAAAMENSKIAAERIRSDHNEMARLRSFFESHKIHEAVMRRAQVQDDKMLVAEFDEICAGHDPQLGEQKSDNVRSRLILPGSPGFSDA